MRHEYYRTKRGMPVMKLDIRNPQQAYAPTVVTAYIRCAFGKQIIFDRKSCDQLLFEVQPEKANS